MPIVMELFEFLFLLTPCSFKINNYRSSCRCCRSLLWTFKPIKLPIMKRVVKNGKSLINQKCTWLCTFLYLPWLTPSIEMTVVKFVPKECAILVWPMHRKTLSDSVFVLHIGAEMTVPSTPATVHLNAMDVRVQVMLTVTSVFPLPLEI